MLYCYYCIGNGEKVSVNCVYIGPSTTCTAIHTAVDCSIGNFMYNSQ